MALVIHLKKGQQLIVNGAVLENASARTISLLLKNEAAVLRQDDILSPEAAVTPAARTYYALQCVYLFPEERDRYLPNFNELLQSYAKAAPSASAIADDVQAAVAEGRYYAALKRAQALIRHEGQVLSDGEQHTDPALQRPAAPRQSAENRGLGPDPGRIPAESGGRSRG